MYKGELFQLPLDFNAANMYLNLEVLERNGLEMPDEDWTRDDYTELLRGMRGDATPYYWTNRLFGGVVPWLYVNDTSDRKSTRLNSSHVAISYAVFCLKKK